MNISSIYHIDINEKKIVCSVTRQTTTYWPGSDLCQECADFSLHSHIQNITHCCPVDTGSSFFRSEVGSSVKLTKECMEFYFQPFMEWACAQR
jgi:hypothetical protein